MAIALVLVTATGLMVRSMVNVINVEPGFRVGHLLALDLFIPPTKYAGASEKSVLFTQAVQRLRDLPGVRSAGAALCPPLVGVCSDSSFMLADHALKSVVDLPTAACNIVVPGYFEAMQVPLLQGRFFTELDNERSRLVAIINQSFAQRYWPTGSAVGKLIREGGPQGGQPYREIIGVVADVKQSGLDSDPRPEVFLPVTQFPFAPWNALQAMTFVVRTEGNPMGIADRAKNEIHLSDKDLPVTAVRPMTQYMSESIGRRRFATLLLALFAALALMLSAVGTYGVMAYSVSQRRREISLRMALGATAASIRAVVLREVLLLAFLGIGIGSVGALVSTRWLASLLFGVRTTDPLIFGSVAALLLFVALLASYVPVRRAVAVDPATALRAE